ncbi:Variant-specific surface protein, partial [Giardia duodenalis]
VGTGSGVCREARGGACVRHKEESIRGVHETEESRPYEELVKRRVTSTKQETYMEIITPSRGEECKTTIPNCADCESASACVTCNEGYFGPKENTPCQACEDENCATCSEAGQDKCSKCKTADTQSNTLYLKKNGATGICVTEDTCVETTTYYITGSESLIKECKLCAAAIPGCINCNTDGTKCTKCDSNDSDDKVYLKDGRTCVDAASCTSNSDYYTDDTEDPVNGKMCRTCTSGGATACKTCVKSGDGAICKECPDSGNTIFGLNKKSCVAKCPDNASEKSGVCTCNDGFTSNAGSSACVAASSCKTPHCQTCTGEGQEGETCTECVTSYYLTPTAQCVDTCSRLEGYYADSSNVCKPCSPECASCSTAGADKCLSCPPKKVLQYTSESDISGGGSCVDECRANTGGCADCGAVIGGSKYCSRCGDASQAPLNGDCAANTMRTKFCTNASNGACTQCANNYFLFTNYLLSWLPCNQ